EAGSAGHCGLHGCHGFSGLRAIRTTGLRHVRTTAAALPADGSRCSTDEINGGEAVLEIVGHSNDHAGLAIISGADKHHNARAKRLLAFVGKRLEILCRDTRHDPAKEADAADGFTLVAAACSRAAAKGQFLASISKLAFQLLALIKDCLETRDDICRRDLQCGRGRLQALVLLV